MRTGFAGLAGRPNVGKSTLVNRIVGTKVSITSDKPQTTRLRIRGVLNRPDAQVVLVDTPGIHKPRTSLGERLNELAADSISDVDVVMLVLDATAPIGRGDRFVARSIPSDAIVVLNKIDIASPAQVLAQLQAAADLELASYYPVSAVTGEGVDELISAVVKRMPEGPAYYPPDVAADIPEAVWIAELVREQLLIHTRQELPHSIACRVTEWEWPRVRCEILVERESQKGIVIGRGGAVLEAVGRAVRAQLEPGVYLELFVKVDKDWQRRPRALERLGY
jgi:GTP-binding protein Era